MYKSQTEHESHLIFFLKHLPNDSRVDFGWPLASQHLPSLIIKRSHVFYRASFYDRACYYLTVAQKLFRFYDQFAIANKNGGTLVYIRWFNI